MAVISASMDGVDVSLDGQPLFSSPDTFKDFVPAGTHAIVARKDGYLTSELSETFEPGAQKELNIRLYTAEELTEYRHRWPVWMPWTVFGAGVAVAAVGGALHGVGVSKIHKFDDNAKANGLLGITTTDSDRDLRNDGISLQKGAVSLYAVGGAAIVSGITLIILNKAKPYLFGKPVEDSGSAEGSVATPTAVSVTPVISGDGAGVAATGGVLRSRRFAACDFSASQRSEKNPASDAGVSGSMTPEASSSGKTDEASPEEAASQAEASSSI